MLYPLPLIPSATEIPYFVYWPDGLDKPIITEQRPEDVNNNDVLCCRYEVSEQILYYLTTLQGLRNFLVQEYPPQSARVYEELLKQNLYSGAILADCLMTKGREIGLQRWQGYMWTIQGPWTCSLIGLSRPLDESDRDRCNLWVSRLFLNASDAYGEELEAAVSRFTSPLALVRRGASFFNWSTATAETQPRYRNDANSSTDSSKADASSVLATHSPGHVTTPEEGFGEAWYEE